MESFKNKFNIYKYEIIQESIISNYSYYPPYILQNIFEDLESITKITVSQENTYTYLHIFNNFLEISKEIKKVHDNYLTNKSFLLMFGLSAISFDDNIHFFNTSFEKYMKIHLPILQKIFSTSLEYIDEISHILLYSIDLKIKFPNIDEYIIKMMEKQISIEMKYKFSLHLMLNNDNYNDCNTHCSLFYELIQKYRKTKDTILLNEIINNLKYENEIFLPNDIGLANLKKYIWAFSFLYQSLKSEEHEKAHSVCEMYVILLHSIVERFYDCVIHSFLLRLILFSIVDILKTEDICEILYDTICPILAHLLRFDNQTYPYLATLIAKDDIRRFKEYSEFDTGLLSDFFEKFSKIDNDDVIDILTNTVIINPCVLENGEEIILLDKYVIQQHILETQQNPFTRTELTNDMLNEYMIKHKDKIDEFYQKRKTLIKM